MNSESRTEALNAIFTGDTLHHAYLFEGTGHVIVPQLLVQIESTLGISTKGNPDFSHDKFEAFTIDDARQLRERQSTKSFEREGDSGRKIFIIETAAITGEAQNALLKILEEPTAGSHFFIVVPSRWLVLPTVRSRMQIVSIGGGDGREEFGKESAEALAFLAATPATRLSMLQPILEEKDKTRATLFVDSLIGSLHSRIHQKTAADALNELLRCRGYLTDRSSSLKLILEHLALILPATP